MKSNDGKKRAKPLRRSGKKKKPDKSPLASTTHHAPPKIQHAGLGFVLCRTAHLFSTSHVPDSAAPRREHATDEIGNINKPRKPGILIVDAHAIVRRGIRGLIMGSAEFVVAGQAADGEQALAKVIETQPDLMVLDWSLPGKSGVSLIREIKSRCPDTAILVISRYEENMYAQRALRAGAMGYIMLQEAEETILTAIRRILGGAVYVSERITAGALRQFATEKPRTAQSSLDVLTDRELEIFRAIGEGGNLRDIARTLKVSVHTVAAHRGHIISKLGVSGSRKLLQMAVQYASEQWYTPRSAVPRSVESSIGDK